MDFNEGSRALDDLMDRVVVLSHEVWERRIGRDDVEIWLENFDGQIVSAATERINALHLLSHFNHFGLREIREMLNAMFRDLIRYPLVQAVRSGLDGTNDAELVMEGVAEELSATRFLGMGNPSESGSHLLYYFRQESGLSKDLFLHQHQLFDRPVDAGDAQLGVRGLRRVVFIDDILGSGTQVSRYNRILLPALRAAATKSGQEIEIIYCVLFAKPEGLKVVTAEDSLFDDVRAIHVVDSAECAFSDDSHVYTGRDSEAVRRNTGREIASHYGEFVFPGHPLGYKDGQLLIGLHHNVPNNSLPIFWSEDNVMNWNSLFKRVSKV